MALFGPPKIDKLKERGDARALVKALCHLEVRKEAHRALTDLGDPSAVKPLIGALANRDPSVRQAAADLLGDLGDPSAVEPLTPMLDAKWEPERETATEALAKLGEEAVGVLVASLADDEAARFLTSFPWGP